MSEATTAQIQALPLEQLESLADALLAFQGQAVRLAGRQRLKGAVIWLYTIL